MTTPETPQPPFPLLIMLARMRDTAALLARAEEALTGASEYIETDDVELLAGVCARGVDRIISRLELAAGVVEVGEGIELPPAIEPKPEGPPNERIDWTDFEARR